MVWAGQVVSMIGTSMTNFAMGIWAWQQTGRATPLAMVGFFSFAPLIIFTPVAGVLVDRWNRRLVMALSDIGAGLVTLTILALLLLGRLEIWHLYITGVISGLFGAFQFPAYSAAISLMIPKKQYARASGMISMANSGSGILAPILAGYLLSLMDISGILIIDLVTLSIAIAFIFLVRIPEPEKKPRDQAPGAFIRELVYGFRYLIDRKNLLYLQLVFFMGNLFFTIGFTLYNPMILAATAGNSTILGSVRSAGAVGGLIGGLILTAWGGPRKKIHGVLVGWGLSGLFGLVLFGIGGSLMVWMAGSFLTMIIVPVLNGSNQAIWQAKVDPDVQGRVFSVRRVVAQITAPLAMAAAGPLADQVFEPAMRSDGHWMAHLLGPVFGTQPGSGMSVLIFLNGILVIGVVIVAYRIRQIRDVESLTPDHEAGAAS